MRPDRVLLCGGGVENTDLVERLRRRLGPCPVESTDDHGLPAHQVEAVLFAWLAQQRLAARPLATGSVTGARHPVVLGSLSLPPGRTGRQ
jgi:anhydro-N-acetylmuramic acid kinase